MAAARIGTDFDSYFPDRTRIHHVVKIVFTWSLSSLRIIGMEKREL